MVFDMHITLFTHLLACLLLVTVWKSKMYFRYLKRNEHCSSETKLNVSVSSTIVFVVRLVTAVALLVRILEPICELPVQ